MSSFVWLPLLVQPPPSSLPPAPPQPCCHAGLQESSQIWKLIKGGGVLWKLHLPQSFPSGHKIPAPGICWRSGLEEPKRFLFGGGAGGGLFWNGGKWG